MTNQIIKVEPDEAALLIELIETLINDWYITRYERQLRLANIISVKDKKEIEKKKAL
jgi:tetrahydromethanopterin S-methyltransferase subunit A